MRTADEHAVWLIQLMAMEGIDPKSITDAIIGSVVPQANFNLRRLCTRYFNCEALFLGEPDVVYGIKVKGAGRRRRPHLQCASAPASCFPGRRCSWSISAPPPPSTWSTRRAATAAA